MKVNLLKTMLASVGLLAGTIGAWAEDTGTAAVKMTYVDWNSQTTSYGEITEGNTAKTGYNKISNGTVDFAVTSWNVNYITYIQVDASAIDGTITGATLTADCSGAGSSSKQRAAKYGVGYNSSTWTADMTYETADRTITTVGSEVSTTSKVQTTFNNLSFDITDALKGDKDKIVTLLVYETAAGGGLIKDPQVTVTYISSSTKTADYTVKYVLQETTTELKTATTGTAEVGGTYKVTDEDKASFFVDGKKYIYVSDDAASQTIKEDGKTVITITFREAATYSYTVNAVDAEGEILKDSIACGTNFEGETFNVAYPYALNIDSTLYTSEKQNSGFYFSITLSEKTTIKTVTYKASDITDVVYFSEAEDIDSLTRATNNNTAIRSSNGASAYAAEADVEFVKLPAGKYKLTTVICDAKSGAGSVWNFTAGNDTIFTFTATNVNWSSGTSDEFSLADETAISLCKGGNANQAVDLIYIQRTGDYVAPEVVIEKFSDLYALEDGTDVTIKTTDAVISVWQSTGTGYFVCVQDGTGAVRLSDDMASMMGGIGLSAGSKIVGTIYAKYTAANGTPTLDIADNTQFSSIDMEAAGEVVDVDPVEMTIAEAKQKSSISKYIEIKKAKMWADEDDLSLFYISQGKDTIKVYDKFWALYETFTAPDTIEYVKGVVVLEDGKYTIYPYGEDAVPVQIFEAENIAALANAEENSTVKLMLKDAQITVVSDGRWGTTAYLEDESGAVEFGDVYDFILSESELDIKEGTTLNGYIMVMYAGNWGGMQIMSTDETVTGSIFSAEDDTPTPMETTIAEVKKESNCSRFVSFKNTKIVTERSAEDEDGYSSITAIYMVQGTDRIKVYDSFNALPVDSDNVTVVPDSLLSSEGILGISDGEYLFSPTKIEIYEPETGIKAATNGASALADDDAVYSISGVKVRKAGEKTSGLAKGLYIIGGKKVVVK